MSTENLNNVIGSFHDFDLISADQQETELQLKFECYWNEMNDPDNPYMTFNFEFEDCEFIECDYYVISDSKDENGNLISNNFSTQEISELAKLELSLQSFEVIDGIHDLHCNGNNEVNGGVIKLRFNSPEFTISDEQGNSLTLEEYRKLFNGWWEFVGS